MIGQPLPIKHDLALFKAKDLEKIGQCLNRQHIALPPEAEAVLEEITAMHREGFMWSRAIGTHDRAVFELYSADLIGATGDRNYYLSLRGMLWLRSRGVDVSRPAPIMAVQPSLFGGAP